jgi:hypothetical protein
VIERHPDILVKYGLSADKRLLPSAFISLAKQTANFVQAAYGLNVVRSVVLNEPLEAAAALSELLTVRMQDAEQGIPRTHYPFQRKVDLYDWASITPDDADLIAFDRYGLRAMMSCIRHVSAEKTLAFAYSTDKALDLQLQQATVPSQGVALLQALAVWADVEITWINDRLSLSGKTLK